MTQEILSSQQGAQPCKNLFRTVTATYRKIVRLMARLALAFEMQRQRKRLLELSDVQLADIGITREQAITEARKPFWQ